MPSYAKSAKAKLSSTSLRKVEEASGTPSITTTGITRKGGVGMSLAKKKSLKLRKKSASKRAFPKR